MNVSRSLTLKRTMAMATLLALSLSSSGCWTKLKPTDPAASGGAGTAPGVGPAAGGPGQPQNNVVKNGGATKPGGTTTPPSTTKPAPVVPTADAVAQAQKDCANYPYKALDPIQGAEAIAVPATPPEVRPVSPALQAAFTALTAGQKEVLFHLTNAGRIGRTVRLYQSNRYAMALRSLIASTLSDANATTLSNILPANELAEWRTYAALFYQNAGPYSPEGTKYVLKVVTPTDACILIDAFGRKSMTNNATPIDPTARAQMVDLLVNPGYEPLRKPRDTVASAYADLINSGGNHYAPLVTGDDVSQQIPTKLKPDLNCRVTLDKKSGNLNCEPLNSTHKLIGPAFTNLVNELNLALKVTDANGNLILTKQQQTQAQDTLKFIQDTDQGAFATDHTASLTDWSAADTGSPTIDFLFGFLHPKADDFEGNMGGWESYIDLLNPPLAANVAKLIDLGPALEQTLQFGTSAQTSASAYQPAPTFATAFQMESDIHKDDFQIGTSYLDDEVSPTKQVVLLPALDPTDVNQKAREVFTILHEAFAKKSGTGPRGANLENTLGQEGQEMDELREDMVTLALAGDPRFVTDPSTDAGVGFYASTDEATKVQQAMYNSYVQWAIQRIARDGSPMDARRSTGLWAFLAPLVTNTDGSNTLTIDPIKVTATVADVGKFQQYCATLAASIQSIRASGTEAQLAALIAKANPTSKDWVKKLAASVQQPAPPLNQRWTIVSSANGASNSAAAGNGNSATATYTLQPCGDGTVTKFLAGCDEAPGAFAVTPATSQ